MIMFYDRIKKIAYKTIQELDTIVKFGFFFFIWFIVSFFKFVPERYIFESVQYLV
jgi:hypothetical protein